MKIVVIDNYDSFTYNLVHALEHLSGTKVSVFKNDQYQLPELESYDKIVLSPGPGIPDEAGALKDTINHFKTNKSILGICLGLQAIYEVFGGNLINCESVFHGISTNIIQTDNSEILFSDVSQTFQAGRYHSWIADMANIPENLKITAIDEQGNPMAISHNFFDIKGLQFHPESIMTPTGLKILENWLKYEPRKEINLPYSGNSAFCCHSFSNTLFC